MAGGLSQKQAPPRPQYSFPKSVGKWEHSPVAPSPHMGLKSEFSVSGHQVCGTEFGGGLLSQVWRGTCLTAS